MADTILAVLIVGAATGYAIWLIWKLFSIDDDKLPPGGYV